MSIVTTDLVKLASLLRPVDDVATCGGDIDVAYRASFTQMGANAQIALQKSANPSTETVTVKGRNAAGVRISEDVVLNSAAEFLTVATYERLHSVSSDTAQASRTIAVKQGAGGTLLGTVAAGEKGLMSLFVDAFSASTPKTRFELEYWKNIHATLTLTNAELKLTADPSARIRVGVAAAKGSAGSIANRLAVPGGITFVDDGVTITVPTGTLAAAEYIGLWEEQALLSDDPPIRSSYTTQLRGTTV